MSVFAFAFEVAQGRQQEECGDHGRPSEESEHVGAGSLAAEVEDPRSASTAPAPIQKWLTNFQKGASTGAV